MMENNIDLLLKKTKRTKESLKSLEELPHITLYRDGEQAYDEKDYTRCVTSFEESLTLFFKEEEKCHAVCETKFGQEKGTYSATLFNYFKSIIQCRQKCRLSLTKINGRTSSTHFVPYYFHYLQYCYFKGKIKKK